MVFRVLLTCFVFLAPILISSVTAKTPDAFCETVRNKYPELQWTRLESGVVLITYDAVLTCESSRISLETETAFEPSIIQWEKVNEKFLGELPSETLLVVRSESGMKTQPDIEMKIATVTGEVFYSTERELIKTLGLLHSFVKNEKHQRTQSERDNELQAIGWEPLKINRLLESWDMIWTQKHGRVEIEIVEFGRELMTSESTDVRDFEGKWTQKKRFPEKSYFIMHPQLHRMAKVNKIIGDVWIATDRSKVRAFFNKYHSDMSIRAGMDPDAQRKWQEMLRKEDLE